MLTNLSAPAPPHGIFYDPARATAHVPASQQADVPPHPVAPEPKARVRRVTGPRADAPPINSFQHNHIPAHASTAGATGDMPATLHSVAEAAVQASMGRTTVRTAMPARGGALVLAATPKAKAAPVHTPARSASTPTTSRTSALPPTPRETPQPPHNAPLGARFHHAAHHAMQHLEEHRRHMLAVRDASNTRAEGARVPTGHQRLRQGSHPIPALYVHGTEPIPLPESFPADLLFAPDTPPTTALTSPPTGVPHQAPPIHANNATIIHNTHTTLPLGRGLPPPGGAVPAEGMGGDQSDEPMDGESTT